VSIEEMKIFLLDVEAKLKRQALSAQLANTLDNQIADQQIVEGGLEEIEEAVKRAYERAKLVDTKSLDFRGKEKFYNFIKSLMQVAFFTCVPQGRESGVALLLYDQRSDLLGEEGAAYTDKFKTATGYGFQPVLANDFLQEMLTTYLREWRPLLKYIMPKEILLDDKGFLWPKFKPVMSADDSDAVATFVLNETGIHMTTNKFRALWEMRAEWLRRTDQISAEQRAAVSGVNTHSGTKTKNTFLIRI